MPSGRTDRIRNVAHFDHQENISKKKKKLTLPGTVTTEDSFDIT
jgi:hypothetical protein